MTQVGIEPTSMWISPINITIYNNDYSVDQTNSLNVIIYITLNNFWKLFKCFINIC